MVGIPPRAAVVRNTGGARQSRIPLVPSVVRPHLDRWAGKRPTKDWPPSPESTRIAFELVYQYRRRRPARAIRAAHFDHGHQDQRARRATASAAGPSDTGAALELILAPQLDTT